MHQLIPGPDRSVTTSEKYKQFIGHNISVGKILTKREDEAGMERISPESPDH